MLVVFSADWPWDMRLRHHPTPGTGTLCDESTISALELHPREIKTAEILYFCQIISWQSGYTSSCNRHLSCNQGNFVMIFYPNIYLGSVPSQWWFSNVIVSSDCHAREGKEGGSRTQAEFLIRILSPVVQHRECPYLTHPYQPALCRPSQTSHKPSDISRIIYSISFSLQLPKFI